MHASVLLHQAEKNGPFRIDRHCRDFLPKYLDVSVVRLKMSYESNHMNPTSQWEDSWIVIKQHG